MEFIDVDDIDFFKKSYHSDFSNIDGLQPGDIIPPDVDDNYDDDYDDDAPEDVDDNYDEYFDYYPFVHRHKASVWRNLLWKQSNTTFEAIDEINDEIERIDCSDDSIPTEKELDNIINKIKNFLSILINPINKIYERNFIIRNERSDITYAKDCVPLLYSLLNKLFRWDQIFHLRRFGKWRHDNYMLFGHNKIGDITSLIRKHRDIIDAIIKLNYQQNSFSRIKDKFQLTNRDRAVRTYSSFYYETKYGLAQKQ